jgi:hypothetical protein
VVKEVFENESKVVGGCLGAFLRLEKSFWPFGTHRDLAPKRDDNTKFGFGKYSQGPPENSEETDILRSMYQMSGGDRLAEFVPLWCGTIHILLGCFGRAPMPALIE